MVGREYGDSWLLAACGQALGVGGSDGRDCSRVVALDAQCDNSWTLVAIAPGRAAATIQK
ncbi:MULTISPECIES: hypothetical protein [unclassified Rathayibacter]|uniref:hypothetical protein n=1 Tax=unclassified Rathayibacter TaxID=2609250 RepID=UPI0011B02EDE|nr:MULTISPECIES: hypothetical protein [unclassified Rathayibacter]